MNFRTTFLVLVFVFVLILFDLVLRVETLNQSWKVPTFPASRRVCTPLYGNVTNCYCDSSPSGTGVCNVKCPGPVPPKAVLTCEPVGGNTTVIQSARSVCSGILAMTNGTPGGFPPKSLGQFAKIANGTTECYTLRLGDAGLMQEITFDLWPPIVNAAGFPDLMIYEKGVGTHDSPNLATVLGGIAPAEDQEPEAFAISIGLGSPGETLRWSTFWFQGVDYLTNSNNQPLNTNQTTMTSWMGSVDLFMTLLDFDQLGAHSGEVVSGIKIRNLRPNDRVRGQGNGTFGWVSWGGVGCQMSTCYPPQYLKNNTLTNYTVSSFDPDLFMVSEVFEPEREKALDPQNIPTGFTGSETSWLWTMTDSTGINNALTQFADINGDNFLDYCRQLNATTISCKLGGTSTPGKEVGVSIDLGTNGQFIDADGDSRADFCRVLGNPPKPSCLLSGALGWSTVEYSISLAYPVFVGTGFRRFANPNGDEFIDFCRETGIDTLSCLVGGSGGFTTEEYGGVFSLGDPATIRQFGDVNGDGKEDFCRKLGDGTKGNLHRISCLLASTEGFSTVEFSAPSYYSMNLGVNNNVRQVADVNKDKRADYCRQPTDTPSICCLLAGATGWTTQEFCTPVGVSVNLGAVGGRQFVPTETSSGSDYCRIIGTGTTTNPYKPSCLLGKLESDEPPFCEPFEVTTTNAGGIILIPFQAFVWDFNDNYSDLKIVVSELPACGKLMTSQGVSVQPGQAYMASEIFWSSCLLRNNTSLVSFFVLDSQGQSSTTCAVSLVTGNFLLPPSNCLKIKGMTLISVGDINRNSEQIEIEIQSGDLTLDCGLFQFDLLTDKKKREFVISVPCQASSLVDIRLIEQDPCNDDLMGFRVNCSVGLQTIEVRIPADGTSTSFAECMTYTQGETACQGNSKSVSKSGGLLSFFRGAKSERGFLSKLFRRKTVSASMSKSFCSSFYQSLTTCGISGVHETSSIYSIDIEVVPGQCLPVAQLDDSNAERCLFDFYHPAPTCGS